MPDLLDSNLRIVPYGVSRIPDPWAAAHELSWQDYHHARNKIVQACRRHGPVGPMGLCDVRPDSNQARLEAGDEDPVYFVLDDQLNHERYIYIDMLSRSALSRSWLADIVVTLGTLPYWGVGIMNIARGYVLIFPNMLLVAGTQFERQELEHVIERWGKTLII